tara:strand:- start:1138 stop:4539 length:3402 start_codon:yes stop_codon:yes gene_type:complete
MALKRTSIKNIFISFLLAGLVFANVTISLSDVEVDGYTENIVVPVHLSNPINDVGGFQFDIISLPTFVELSGVTPIDAENFNTDYTVFDNGSGRVVFYSNDGNGIIAGGDNVVLNLHFYGSDVLSALLDLDMYNLVVSNEDGDLLEGTAENGSITIGHMVYLSASTDTGDVNEEVYLDIYLDNPGIVGGLQFDIFDAPNYLDVTDFATTDRSNGFSVDFTEMDNGMTRVLMYNANNENIQAGDGSILNMTMTVHENAYNSNVALNFKNVIVTDDMGGTYWIAAADSGTVIVTPGYIEEPHNLIALDGEDAQVELNWSPPQGPAFVFLDETFDEGLSDSWTIVDGGDQGFTWEWIESYESFYGASTLDGTPFLYCDADAAGSGSWFDDELVSPVFPTSGELFLSFDHFYVDYASDNVASIANVDVWNGTQWVNVYQVSENGLTLGAWDTPDQQILDISSHSNGQFKLRFHYITDPTSWEYYWAIDNIRLANYLRDGRYSAVYELSPRGWSLINQGTREEMKNVFSSGNWPYAYSDPETFEIVDNSLSIENQNSRPIDIDAYKVYRSLNEAAGFEEIAEVDGGITTYLDDNVVNSTTYYYYVTAIYPDGSESGPTNTVSATPVEWVELWMDDGASLTGQMDTLDFYINNESDLGLFYFEILDYPDVINSINIFPTERTSNWSIEISDQGNGTIAITGLSLGPALTSGDGAVCSAVLYPDAAEAMTVSLSYTSSTAVQDMNYIDLNWYPESATYDVGIETQYLHFTGGAGEGGSEFLSSIILDNTQPVYAIQLDISADPPLMIGTNVIPSSSHDFSNWDISGTVIGNFYRLVMIDNSQTSPINPGMSHIADLTFEIDEGAPVDMDVVLDMIDGEISDINGLPMHMESIPGHVHMGLPEVMFTIQNASGVLEPGGVGTFEVHMDNTELVGTLQFTLAEMPENITVTNVSPVDRFADGIIDGSSEEQEDGTYYFLGFDFSTGIEAGSGPILEFEVQFPENLNNSSIFMVLDPVAAGDAGANPLTTIFHHIGQFTGFLSLDNSATVPNEFALYPNFPNPFNPATMITYDLPKDIDVRIEIYDIMGRNINTLVNQNMSAGRHFIPWNATDILGNQVSGGIYLYRLQAGENVLTRKMILMK